MRSVVLLAAVLMVSCFTSAPVPSPSTLTTVAPSQPVVAPRVVAPTLRTVAIGNGLVLDVPLRWTIDAGPEFVNRATMRYLLAGNGDLTGLPTVYGNGDVDPAVLGNDRVVIAVEAFCRLSCQGPTTETALPLDWATATKLYDVVLPADRHQQAVGFRWFDQPLYLVARWGDSAPTADISAIADVAKSIRPERLVQAQGEFMGWDGVGPLNNIPVGSVTLRPLPPGAVVPPNAQTYDTAPYYLVRGNLNVYAFSSRPLIDQRCELQFDAAADRFWCQIESRRVEWTRFGRFLGPEPASDLVQHRVIVRDGTVWIRYGESTLLTPSVANEAAER